MIYVLHIEGKREDLDRITVHGFESNQEAEQYCQTVNKTMFNKYYDYAEIIQLGTTYEPLITFEHKSIK